MAGSECPSCHGPVQPGAARCPHCEVELAARACDKCGGALVVKVRQVPALWARVVGAVCVVLGLVGATRNAGNALVAILGVLLFAFVKSTRRALLCPACGYEPPERPGIRRDLNGITYDWQPAAHGTASCPGCGRYGVCAQMYRDAAGKYWHPVCAGKRTA